MVQLINKLDKEVKITRLSESAVVVSFGEEICFDLHEKVKALTNYLQDHSFVGLIETVPSFTSVTIFYDPIQIYKRERKVNHTNVESPSDFVCAYLKEAVQNLGKIDKHRTRIVEIPVCYGGAFGPDLDYVADHNDLSPEQVVKIHSSGDYLVYMVGFAPGFPYLGGMSEKIATPRREKPRIEIPQGSVGIAGMQTGVYSLSTPGGWQIIGRTPFDLFLKDKTPPSLLESGDVVRFRPITVEEYDDYKEGS
ncbi:5-oxoprolinase subunit PxpB [Halalkalibacter alkaliphilus]|uniref:5-oxoprolinase subunit PxpB n=1 Tax=Halalkalibacter alkaliphilus TaxID=2917993 RepID=A0A9X2CWZ3_9BACI|nr:5-oxoprolinase subunit PxpB [Halalkalibacter alkaliphilus]MCL7749657.1 5-oxoprolinase subunit PxpB [Halalkalibacter alkaliphilus]